ncbi:ABC transporter substrate-binding protein [Fibrobacter sp.]|uniref:ABC transporter substrate-binding protein n=1 Tax=Fibrobacter sp. TaxID=35828 RepID=UPI002618EAD2|nr:ABC transporter substrate-binding protein [Fibrobacter sp.]MDD5942738.1 ABC transporter substrate-binding protein [Fibrobacter sp.]
MLNFCGKMVARGALVLLGAVFSLLCSACGNGGQSGKSDGCGELATLEYARNLKMGSPCDENLLEVRSVVGRDTLVKRFALRKRAEGEGAAEGVVDLSHGRAKETVLRVPLERVVALSSAQVGFLLRLGLMDRIVAVGEGKYIADSALYARVQRGEVAEVGNGTSISLEKILAVRPDLVMDFATGGSQDDYERINSLGIPLMLTSEWQEEHPLAKIEWIKLFGKLFGVEARADSIYEQSKNAYLQAANGGVAGVSPARGGSGPAPTNLTQLRQRVAKFRISAGSGTFVTEPTKESEGETSPNKSEVEIASPSARNDTVPCPRVIAGVNYGGVWYAPGGNSFTAHLIRDAGGCYLWASDTSRELTFTLEEIMLVADSADVWVNPGAFSSAEDILAAEPRVKHIRAFREKRVCQNDGRKGPGGGNDFYESAVAYPAELLQSLRNCIQNATNGADSARKEFDWYRNIFIF